MKDLIGTSANMKNINEFNPLDKSAERERDRQTDRQTDSAGGRALLAHEAKSQKGILS